MIYLAADHAGFELKNKIAEYLKTADIEYTDIGPFQYDASDDYPDFIIPAAKKVVEHPDINRGIIFGASGQGEAMAANKVKGIRATVYYGGPEEIISLSKVHNDANVLSIGAKFVRADEATKVVRLWLNSEFLNEERHIRRIEKIKKYENNKP